MTLPDKRQFLLFYQQYRYQNQLDFYERRAKQLNQANTGVISIMIGLLFLTSMTAGIASSVSLFWLKLLCLLIAAISPALVTALSGYSALYAFEQQAKLYQDTINNLYRVHALEPNISASLSEAQFEQQFVHYIHEVESTFLLEQGQWGQLARNMKPSSEI